MGPLVRPFTDPAGGQWFVVSGRYGTDALGAAAYNVVMAHTKRGDLGLYRHGEPGAGGVIVSAVSTMRADVQRVAELLTNCGAVDEQLHPVSVERLVVRRARVILDADARDAKPGRIKIRHAGRGAYLRPDGTMSDDQPQGQG